MVKKKSNWFLTFITGSLIGAAAMLVTAPRGGGETRQMIKSNIDFIIKHAEIILEKVRTPAYRITDQTLRIVQVQKNYPEIVFKQDPET